MFAGLWILTTISFLENPHESKYNIIITIIITLLILLLSMVFLNKVLSVLCASIMGSLFMSYLSKRTSKNEQ